MKFELKRKELPVELVDTDGTSKMYTLRELSGDERVGYQNRMSKNVKTDAAGKSTVKSFDGVESELIFLCLYDSAGIRVPVNIISQFPSSVQLALFEAAAELSGLGPKAEDNAKNS